MSEQDLQQQIEEVEERLRAVLADDIEVCYGDDGGNVVVLDYVAVAKVLDEDGNPGTRWTSAQDATNSDILGWIEWLKILIEERVRKGQGRD